MKVSPKDATYKQICKMRRDHFSSGDFSLMTDGDTVWLSEQKMGEARMQHFEISKRRLNRLLSWYLKEVEI